MVTVLELTSSLVPMAKLLQFVPLAISGHCRIGPAVQAKTLLVQLRSWPTEQHLLMSACDQMHSDPFELAVAGTDW